MSATRSDDPRLVAITREIVDASCQLYFGMGPGMLESIHESVLARDIERRGLRVERQKMVSFAYDEMRFDNALRIDLMVESAVIVEVKSIEKLAPVHPKQLLTYLRLLDLPVGLLLNFGAATFSEVVRRVSNSPKARAAAEFTQN